MLSSIDYRENVEISRQTKQQTWWWTDESKFLNELKQYSEYTKDQSDSIKLHSNDSSWNDRSKSSIIAITGAILLLQKFSHFQAFTYLSLFAKVRGWDPHILPGASLTRCVLPKHPARSLNLATDLYKNTVVCLFLVICAWVRGWVMEGTSQGNSFNQFYFPWNFATHQWISMSRFTCILARLYKIVSVTAQGHSPLASQGKFSSPHKFSFPSRPPLPHFASYDTCYRQFLYIGRYLTPHLFCAMHEY